jgi:hypothetical protein
VTSLVSEGAPVDPYELASEQVRSYCGQIFDAVADDVVLIDPRPNGTAQLPEMPVTAVTAVSAFMPDPTGVWDWQALTAFAWVRRGLIYDTALILPSDVLNMPVDYPMPTWPWLPGSLRVTYSHGYNPIPAPVQAIVTRLAAQIAANPAFLVSNKVGEVGASFGPTAGVTLRDTDRKILDRYTIQEVA